jgi:hypothetical protein
MHQRIVRGLTALSAVLLAACQDAPTSSTAPDDDPSFARSPQGQERLAQAFARATPDVMDLAGTVFADVDEARGRLVYGIETIGAARAVEQALSRAGVSATDYEIRLVPAVQFMATLQNSDTRPVLAGVQINFTQYVCTMGFNVNLTGQASFITNSHCTGKQGGVENTLYYQPLKSSHPTAIAVEVADPLYGKLPGCSRGKSCRYSDASRAVYQNGVTGTYAIAKTSAANNGSLDITGSFSVTGQNATQDNFPVGTVVNKVGRTTGWTRGQVTSSCATVNVSGSKLQLLCQTLVQDNGGATLVGGGDSGSGVFTVTTNATIVGVLWGGSGDGKLFVFSPLKNIISELGALRAY